MRALVCAVVLVPIIGDALRCATERASSDTSFAPSFSTPSASFQTSYVSGGSTPTGRQHGAIPLAQVQVVGDTLEKVGLSLPVSCTFQVMRKTP